MSIKMKHSQFEYTYLLGHDQLLLRGSSLKITQWAYGIVVYTGQESKIKQNEQKLTRLKSSRMEQIMNKQIVLIFFLKLFIALAGTLLGE
mmetsp:Transcript_10331/g.17362  ORF Transcript_10331/g.17362 Transcript_10331/m.17362 type:complete len:90 (-) Transcript_10331:519-788(-)